MHRALREFILDIVKRRGDYSGTLLKLACDASALDAKIRFVNHADTDSRADFTDKEVKVSRNLLTRLASSSGTSGRPLVFPQRLDSVQAEQAFIDFLWRKVGYSPGSRVLVMRGMSGFHIKSRFLNRLVFSADEWTDEEVIQKYAAFCGFQPEFIHCYPSTLERFLNRCLALNLNQFPRVRGILAGSEACLDHHEKIFSCLLGAETVSWYGQSEQVALALKVRSNEFHLLLQYSEIAFIRHESNHLEIVGRSLLNPYFGERWYRTSDFCESVEAKFSQELGRPCIAIYGLTGRGPEFIETQNGQLIPFNSLLFGLHGKFWRSVTRYCFVHDHPGRLTFYFARALNETPEELLRHLLRRIPTGIEFFAAELPDLERVDLPKWRYYFDSVPSFISNNMSDRSKFINMSTLTTE